MTIRREDTSAEFPADVPSEARGWAVAAHLSPWVGLWFIGPLIIWLIKRDEDPFVEEHARESLNFQISTSIYYVVSVILMLVLIGFLTFFAVAIFAFVVNIVAAIKAANGDRYQYPLTIRFVKQKPI